MAATAQQRDLRRRVPDLVPLPTTVLERFARLGVNVDELLRRAEIPRSRFEAVNPRGTTAELFALWSAAEDSGITRRAALGHAG
jgi:hypothetical protein